MKRTETLLLIACCLLLGGAYSCGRREPCLAMVLRLKKHVFTYNEPIPFIVEMYNRCGKEITISNPGWEFSPTHCFPEDLSGERITPEFVDKRAGLQHENFKKNHVLLRPHSNHSSQRILNYTPYRERVFDLQPGSYMLRCEYIMGNNSSDWIDPSVTNVRLTVIVSNKVKFHVTKPEGGLLK